MKERRGFPSGIREIDFSRYPDKTKPNLFIIGAARAGTTSLYNYLSQSPEIFMSYVKEPHYFSSLFIDYEELLRKPQKGKHYHTLFFPDDESYLSLFDEAVHFKRIGEASPSYLYDEGAPRLIKKNVPDAKLIALLRDPVERAYSHFLQDVSNGKQSLDFYEALTEDYARQEKGWGLSHLYVELGFYYQQLKRYWDIFDPGQLLILPFDSLKNDLRNTLRKVAMFLGVDDHFSGSLDPRKAYNEFRAPRSPLAARLFKDRSKFRKISDLLPKKLRFLLRDTLVLSGGEKPALEPKAIEFLTSIYRSDMGQLFDHLGEGFDLLKRHQ